MSDASSHDRALPTVVLVHGAWGDATGFDAVIRALRSRGFSTVGFANPLRNLASDAALLATLLRSLAGPIALVGHSYGGAVISNAATGNDQVQALVYLNGWMPDEGESIQSLIESDIFQGSLIPAALRPLPFTNPDGSEGVDLYLDQDLFPEAFAGDVDAQTAAVMAAAQRPWSAGAVPQVRPRSGLFLPGTCSAPRTAPSRLRRSVSWPSAVGRPFRSCRRHMPHLCRSQKP